MLAELKTTLTTLCQNIEKATTDLLTMHGQKQGITFAIEKLEAAAPEVLAAIKAAEPIVEAVAPAVEAVIAPVEVAIDAVVPTEPVPS